MRVQRAEVFRYRLHFRPQVGSASESSPVIPAGVPREGLLVNVSDERGSEGWGEVAPLPGRSVESLPLAEGYVRSLLDDLIGEAIPRTWSDLCAMELGASQPASVAFGVEQALSNLSAAAYGMPVSRWISSLSRRTVRINALISGEAGEAVQTASKRMKEGYRAFKLKVGGQDHERIHRLVSGVRGAIGVDSELRLDANRSWEFDEAAAILRRLDHLGIAYIEEPLRDPTQLRQLTKEVSVPLAMDETLLDLKSGGFSAEDVSYLAAVILKPTLVGGMSGAVKWASLCLESGVESVITSAFESEVGLSGLASLAAAIPGSGKAAGLDTIRFFIDRLVTNDTTWPTPEWSGPIFESVPKSDLVKLTRIYHVSS